MKLKIENSPSMKHLATTILLLLATLTTFAQSEVEMADTFRSEGKIYVVVAVIITILIGLFFYLIRIDRRISRLENDKNHSG